MCFQDPQTQGARHERYSGTQRNRSHTNGRLEARGRRPPCFGYRPRQALLRQPGLAARCRLPQEGRVPGGSAHASGLAVLDTSGHATARSAHFLVVSDIEAARKELVKRGVDVSEVFHGAARKALSKAATRTCPAMGRSPRSAIRMAIAGYFRRSPHGCLDASTRTSTAFTSSSDLEAALLRAATAHGEHEKRNGGKRDENWPAWYAAYMVAEATGKPLPQ